MVSLRDRQPARLIAAVGALGLVVVASAVAVASRPGDLRCVDVAADVGLTFRGAYGRTISTDVMGAAMQRNMGQGAAVADIDGDGDLDIYLIGQKGHANRLYRNDVDANGRRLFTDVTDVAGVGDEGLGRVAQFVDLTGSGRPDLVLMNDYTPGTDSTPSRIFRNDGDSRFTEVTERSGFDPVGYLVGGLAIADYDGDGRPDLYVSYWTMQMGGYTPGEPVRGRFGFANQLYRNLGGFRFADVTEEAGLGGLSVDAFTAIFTDFSGDHRPDIYLAVDHRPDVYYENEGGGRFRDASEERGVGFVGNGMGASVADLEDDGFLDLYSTNILDPAGQFGLPPRGNILLMGRPSADGFVFTDEAEVRGVRDTAWGWGTEFVDANLDGWLDLYAVQGFDEVVGPLSPSLRDARAYLFLNDGTNRFTRAVDKGCDVAGDQRALVVFDYDRNGTPDFLVTQVGGPVVLLENQVTGRHWLTVDLSGAGARGLGARIRVEAGGHSTTQLVLGGGSYLSGPPHEAYFGLASATRVDRVRVTWADGTESYLQDLSPDQIVRFGPEGQLR